MGISPTPTRTEQRRGRILVIVGQVQNPPLLSEAELDNIAAFWEVRVLSGAVSKQRILATVIHERFDVVHFIGHSDQFGLILPDGDHITATDLAGYVQASGSHLVFLNSCHSSFSIDDVLELEDVLGVIAVIGQVADDRAIAAATLFYLEYARHGNAWLAYKRSQPSIGRPYIFQFGKSVDIPSYRGPLGESLAIQYDELAQALSKVETRLTYLTMGVAGMASLEVFLAVAILIHSLALN